MGTNTTTFKVIPPDGRRDEPDFEARKPPVPPEISDRVAQALAQQVERAQMSMARSWGREAAQSSLQASLDIHRALQTGRIALTVGQQMTKSIIELSDKTEKAIADRPELQAVFREMEADTMQLLLELNKITAVGYLRRYYKAQ